VLVNNAGVAPPAKQIYKVDPEEWQQTMDINVRAAWYLSKVCHPHMKQRGGGAVVNIASTSGLHHDIGLGIYSISKAAVVMLTTVCAKEWARDHIRVNALAPGIIRTELAGPLIEYITSRDVKPNLMNVIGEPEDIARLVRFLVTDESRLITGDVIRIDAGELL
jgi:NAD(P)-dependent dehydrogenase (short-subunit alcohol dehydrogenase family)